MKKCFSGSSAFLRCMGSSCSAPSSCACWPIPPPAAGGELFGRCIVLTLVCLLSLAVYYSRKELTTRGWWLRTALHTLLLEAVLLPLAHHWEFWYGRLDAVIYASFILGAKVVWHLIDYTLSARAATQVNEQLRRRQRGRTGGMTNGDD